jgi:long-chain acyl-CoA synthetase
MERPWLKSYGPGVPADIPYPEGMLVQHILEDPAARFPNRPAAILPAALGKALYAGRVSYRDLERSANRFANGLSSLGVQKGGRIGLILPNSPQFLIAFFGAIKAGAIVVVFDPLSTPHEIESQLIDCGAETVVTMTRFYPAVKQVQPNTLVTRVIATNNGEYFPPIVRAFSPLVRETQVEIGVDLDPRDYSFKQIIRRSSEAPPRVTMRPEDVALLQYARGSGDFPKGAVMTHRNLVSNCLQSTAWRTDAEAGHEVALCIVPFSRLYGMQFGMFDNLFLGGALILLAAVELKQVLRVIGKYQPTVLLGDTALYSELLKYPAIGKYGLRSIRAFLCNPAPLPDEVLKGWENLTGESLVGVYGVSGSGLVTHASPIHVNRPPGGIGLPLPGTLARIVDEKSSSVELAAGQTGKLAVKGEQLFEGYWNRPEETAKAILDGWFITGELARMDAEGFFYLVSKD